MNEFLELFGGPIVVISSIIATILLARRWRKDRHPQSRKFLVGLLYWGPIFLICSMVLHCFRTGYNSIANSVSMGHSVFNFYHYSLQLFGVVLAYQAYVLLGKCRMYTTSAVRNTKPLFSMMALIVFTTLPTFVFTPIGIIPTAVLTITFTVSWFTHRPSQAIAQKQKSIEQTELQLEEEINFKQRSTVEIFCQLRKTGL